MISRDLELRINNNSATLKEPVTVYMYDRGIQLNITIKEYKFRIGQNSTENYLEANNIYKASAIIKSPDGKVFKYPTVKTTVSNNVVHLLITKEWTDESDEAGRYYIQIQLFDDDNSRVSLPPFYITVEKLIFPYDDKQDGDTSGYVDVSGFDSSVIGLEGTVKDESDLSKGFYDRTTWKENMLITSSGLNKLETRLDEIYSGDGFRETEIASYNTTAKTTMGAINELKALLATLQGEISDFILNNSGIPGTPGGGGTPQQVPIESINILNNALTLVPGGNPVALTCTVLPYNYTEDLIWSTSNDSVAVVDNTGKVFAVGSGTVIITCKSSGNNSIYDTITVTVNAESTLVPITGITITTVMEDISIGIPTQIECTVEPEGYTSKLIWTSSNTDIATVDQFGVVTGKAPGDVVIICRSSTNKDIKAELSVTIAEPYTPLQKITLNPESFEVNRGEKYRVAYALTPSNTTEKSVYWYSEDQSIATVDQNGIVTGVGPGETTIRCVSTINSELYGSTTVTSIVKIEDLDIVSESNNIEKGKTLQLGVEYIPADTTQRNVKWTSSDDTIATVDQNGVVTAHKAGNVSITCTSEYDGNVYDEFNLDVIVYISSIEFTNVGSELVIDKGEIAEIECTLLPEDVTEKDVYWTSSDESVATVEGYCLIKDAPTHGVECLGGRITTLKGGKTTIKCISVHDNSIYAECEVTSRVSITGITLSSDITELFYLQNTAIECTLLPEDTTERDVVWSSSDEEIATVDENGLVTPTATGAGKVTITCSSTIRDEVEGSFELEVKNGSVQLLNPTPELVRGETYQIEYETYPINYNVIWSSSDESIATVDTNGLVTAHKAGDVTIKCSLSHNETLYDEYSFNIIIILPEDLIISTLDSTLYVTQTRNICYTFKPNNVTEREVIWSSSDESVATVDENGIVTAHKKGDVTITCVSASVPTLSKDVNIHIEFGSIELTNDLPNRMDKGETYQLTATTYPNDNMEIIWVSSDNNIATVDNNGLVTVVGDSGDFYITCTLEGDTTVTDVTSVSTINVYPTSIIIENLENEIVLNDTYELKYNILPDNYNVDINITCSPEAAINDNIVTFNKSGIYTITVDSHGISDSITVNVLTDSIIFKTKGSKQLSVNGIDVENQVVELYSEENGIKVCAYNYNEPITSLYFSSNDDLVAIVRAKVNLDYMIDMSDMFSGCSSLSSLDGISNWDVSNVYKMEYMFSGCSSLTSLNGISNWDVSDVNYMRDMFSGCNSLTSLDGISNWDVRNVGDMQMMFSGCNSLISLDGISNWDVRNLSNTSYMFYECSSLTSLDGISNWDISNVYMIDSMFEGCVNMTGYADPDKYWNTDKYGNDCFRNCIKLDNYDEIPDDWK